MNKIVWIDLETGGLNDEVINLEEPIILPNGRKIEHVSGSQYYPILEIGIVITDNDLNILDTYQAEIKNNKRVLDKMDAWCMDQHNKTGLIQKSLKSEKTIEQSPSPSKKAISRESASRDISSFAAETVILSITICKLVLF